MTTRFKNQVFPVLFIFFSHISCAQEPPPFYFGSDLSYVNEMEDCDGVYRENDQVKDAFEIFTDHGNNLVRVRIWHNPTWTDYSNFADARKTIQRAKAAGMGVLLDYHYSDDWADPSKQIIPAAWESLDFDTLKDSVYQYTFDVLNTLLQEQLMPVMVQLGNEINPGMLLPEGSTENWNKLGQLLNAGIQAVREVETLAGSPVEIMLHVAQPENVFPWVESAMNEGNVTDFDIIGLSYYRNWSYLPLREIPSTVHRLATAFNKEVIIVETAYPWTLDGADPSNNILGANSLEDGFPATPDGQSNYMKALTQAIHTGGGHGIVYWEPAWISTGCSTRWGQGSHWENATFFDFHNGNEVLPGIDYMRQMYTAARTFVSTIRVDMTGRNVSNGVFLAGDMTYDGAGNWQHLAMTHEGDNIYSIVLPLTAEVSYAFNFYNGRNWNSNKESLPASCSGYRGTHRLLQAPESESVFDYTFGNCTEDDRITVTLKVDMTGYNTPDGVYIAGDLTQSATGNWQFVRLAEEEDNVFSTTLSLVKKGHYPFAFYTGTSWQSDEKEDVPHECATAWDTHRTLTVPDEETVLGFAYGRCNNPRAVNTIPDEPENLGNLKPNYPNPFSQRTTFEYRIDKPQHVKVQIFDIMGRLVATLTDDMQPPAAYRVFFDARDLASGTYLFRLQTDEQVAIQKMMLVR